MGLKDFTVKVRTEVLRWCSRPERVRFPSVRLVKMLGFVICEMHKWEICLMPAKLQGCPELT